MTDPWPPAYPMPVAIGPANAELMTGVGWRFLRTRFPELVRQLGERKSIILARDLEAALAGRDPRDEAAEDAEAYAARLGLVSTRRTP